MKFYEQIIDILVVASVLQGMNRLEIPAMIGEGSGLAYHKAPQGGYSITHLGSGYAVAQRDDIDETIARFWLEEAAQITDWTITDFMNIASNIRVKYRTPLAGQPVRDALERARARAAAQEVQA
jgi:hypothetical protein